MTEGNHEARIAARMDRIETRIVPMLAQAAQAWFTTYGQTAEATETARDARSPEMVESKVEVVIGPGGDSATVRLITMNGEGDELAILRTVELDLRGAQAS